jgi:hypothetical protein
MVPREFFESHFDPHWIETYRDYTFIMKSGRALVLSIPRRELGRCVSASGPY